MPITGASVRWEVASKIDSSQPSISAIVHPALTVLMSGRSRVRSSVKQELVGENALLIWVLLPIGKALPIDSG